MAKAGWPWLLRLALGLLLAMSMTAQLSKAQFPDKFTNLKVLPKEITKQQLQSTMRGFAFALGVRCEHCHAEKPGGQKFELDFASDDKEEKKTARLMLEMVSGINRDTSLSFRALRRLRRNASPATTAWRSPVH